MTANLPHRPALAVLNEPVAQALLHSRIPARLGYLDGDGEPRVVPVWSHWNGKALVIGTFTDSEKLRAIHEGDRVAVSIDTQDYPYQALQLRGRVSLSQMPGLVPEYVLAAKRYLDAAEADEFLARLGDQPMVRITIDVLRARLLDMRR